MAAHEIPRIVFQSKSLATDAVPLELGTIDVAVELKDGAIVVVAPSGKVYDVQHAVIKTRGRGRVRKNDSRSFAAHLTTREQAKSFAFDPL
jgi:hypothetical protein